MASASVAGKELRCTYCGGKEFEARRAVMDTRGMTFFGLSWANRGATEYVCGSCHFVMTFADPR